MQVDTNKHNWNIIKYENETILPICLYGNNRPSKTLEYNQKVLVEYFGLAINYVICPFPAYSHGFYMDRVLESTVDSIKPDYYWFIDVDCIILKQKTIDIFYNLVKNKMGIAGHSQQSNHKKNKITNSVIHAFPSQAFLWFSRDWYNKVNRPSMDHYSDGTDEFGGDTAELFAYKTKEAGGIVNIIYPSKVVDPFSPLDSGLFFGRGNTFGDNLIYHQMRADLEISETEFIEVAKKVLNGEFES